MRNACTCPTWTCAERTSGLLLLPAHFARAALTAPENVVLLFVGTLTHVLVPFEEHRADGVGTRRLFLLDALHDRAARHVLVRHQHERRWMHARECAVACEIVCHPFCARHVPGCIVESHACELLLDAQRNVELYLADGVQRTDGRFAHTRQYAILDQSRRARQTPRHDALCALRFAVSALRVDQSDKMPNSHVCAIPQARVTESSTFAATGKKVDRPPRQFSQIWCRYGQ